MAAEKRTKETPLSHDLNDILRQVQALDGKDGEEKKALVEAYHKLVKREEEELMGSLKPPKLGTNRFLTYDGDMTVAVTTNIRDLLAWHSEICQKEEVTLDTSYRILLKCASSNAFFKKTLEIHRDHESTLEYLYPTLLKRFKDSSI